MEQKLVRVPFDIELAKKITNGEIEGRIVTRDGRSARVACWDLKAINKSYSILALIDNGNKEVTWTYSNKGFSNTELESKHDLMLEIPEYMSFKDGDVLMLRNQFEFVYVKNSTNGKYGSYVGIALDDYCLFFDSRVTSEYDEGVVEYRHATEEEKQKLIDALKDSKKPKAKEYLKRLFGIEAKQECEFKPFDRVLVRDEGGIWFADIFSHYANNSDYEYKTAGGGSWEYCIPYNDQTAHLLGTTEDYKGE